MTDNLELKYLKSILKTDQEKEILEWLDQELSTDEIIKKIIEKGKK